MESNVFCITLAKSNYFSKEQLLTMMNSGRCRINNDEFREMKDEE